MWVTRLKNRFLILAGYSESLTLLIWVSGQSVQKPRFFKGALWIDTVRYPAVPGNCTRWCGCPMWKTKLLHIPECALKGTHLFSCLNPGAVFCKCGIYNRDFSQGISGNLMCEVECNGFKTGDSQSGNLDPSVRFRPTLPTLSVS